MKPDEISHLERGAALVVGCVIFAQAVYIVCSQLELRIKSSPNKLNFISGN